MLSLVANLYMVHAIPKPKIISLVILYSLWICIERKSRYFRKCVEGPSPPPNGSVRALV